MNYLAHLSLSFAEPPLMVGNFIADEIRAKDVYTLPEDIALGVYLHRQIDDYTDRHPSYLSAVKRLRQAHTKYAPVIIDIVFDHFLSVDWSTFHDDDLDDFMEKCYSAMESQLSSLKGRALLHTETALTHRYLHVYGSRKGLSGVMSRMDRRTKFPSDFVGAVDVIWDQYESYRMDFREVYTSLCAQLPSMLDQAGLTLEMKRNSKGSTK